MAPAWQVREARQRALVKELVAEIHRAADGSGLEEENFLAKVGLVMYSWTVYEGRLCCMPDDSTSAVISVIGEKVHSFARVVSETKLLYHLLFQELLAELTIPIKTRYLSDGIHREMEVYGTTRMAEVPDVDEELPR